MKTIGEYGDSLKDKYPEIDTPVGRYWAWCEDERERKFAEAAEKINIRHLVGLEWRRRKRRRRPRRDGPAQVLPFARRSTPRGSPPEKK